jgi:hypothetical protein
MPVPVWFSTLAMNGNRTLDVRRSRMLSGSAGGVLQCLLSFRLLPSHSKGVSFPRAKTTLESPSPSPSRFPRFGLAWRPLATDVVAFKLLAEFTNLVVQARRAAGPQLVGELLGRTGPLWTGQCRLMRLRVEARRLQHPLSELPSKSTGGAREPHFPGRCHCLNPIDNPSSSPSCSARC